LASTSSASARRVRASLVDFWQASEGEMDVREAFVTSA
jgi:hypothetical protein